MRIQCPAVLLTISMLAIAACERQPPAVRSYDVPTEAAPATAMTPPATPASDPSLPLVMQWDLPEGWTTAPDAGSMRFATLLAGDGQQRIEVAISSLLGTAGGVPANINRWRGQVGLPPADDAELQRTILPITARGANGLMVDLVAPPSSDGTEGIRMFAAMFPTTTSTWFIKTTGMNSALDAQRDAFMSLCRSVSFGASDSPDEPHMPPLTSDVMPPPVMPPARPAQLPSAPPSSDGGDSLAWGALPVGWSVDAAPAAMSIASFTVTDGDQEAYLTITPLGGNQDLLANINRWRRQVGQGPLNDLTAAALTPIDVAGSPGQLVDISGDTHTIAAVASRGGTTWFYKLTGPDPLVANQRDAFRSFMSEVHFK